MKTIQQQISKAHRKLDKLFQQEMIQKMPYSILGGRTEVIHHFIYKSQSTFLRYEPKNAIPLTNAQHFTLHSKGGLEAKIGLLMGKERLDWLDKHKSILVKRDKCYLEELLLKINNHEQ